LKLISRAFARSEVVEREGPSVGPLVALEVGSIVGPKVDGVHPTVGAKLGFVYDAPTEASAVGRLVGTSLDRIRGVVVGTSDRVPSTEEIP
jgi:hypothetical protein